MSDSKTLGILASAVAAIVGIAAVVRAIPNLCKSIIEGIRKVVQFNDAIPSVLALPHTMKLHGDTLEKQNAVLAEIQSDVKELKEARSKEMSK